MLYRMGNSFVHYVSKIRQSEPELNPRPSTYRVDALPRGYRSRGFRMQFTFEAIYVSGHPVLRDPAFQ